MLPGAEADGEGSAGGNQRPARVAQPDTEGETDRYRKNEDEIGTKGLRFPIEDEAVGEVRGAADAGDGADISVAFKNTTA